MGYALLHPSYKFIKKVFCLSCTVFVVFGYIVQLINYYFVEAVGFLCPTFFFLKVFCLSCTVFVVFGHIVHLINYCFVATIGFLCPTFFFLKESWGLSVPQSWIKGVSYGIAKNVSGKHKGEHE